MFQRSFLARPILGRKNFLKFRSRSAWMEKFPFTGCLIPLKAAIEKIAGPADSHSQSKRQPFDIY
jgi:hypothetical protein